MSPSMPKLCSLCLMALAIAVGGWEHRARAAEDPTPVRFKALTPAARAHLDRLAGEQDLEGLREETVNLAGDVTGWLINQAALTARQEADHVAAMHNRLLAQVQVAETPAAAERVWRRLLQNLPAYLKPSAFRFTLTVVDEPRFGVFTWGGGQVYITRPLLERLLENPERGETALAFVLAQQLGHISRQHCRRGWQLVQVQEDLNGQFKLNIEPGKLQRILETSVHASGPLLYFLYSRQQHYEADCFAWQLCRNASLDLDQALDALRYQAVLAEPRMLTDPDFRPAKAGAAPTLRYYLSEQPEPLVRLKRLMMERDGQVGDEKNYGLFCYDPASDSWARCGPRSVTEGMAPLVLVHGLRGDRETFHPFVVFLREQKELLGRPILVFRYPNNESLARCGLFLAREMARVVVSPEKTAFICHSAGGLVLRYYAEVTKGSFDRAFLLGTPNQGSSLTALKYLVDLAQFAVVLRQGLPAAIAATIPEGRGEVGNDLHPDSLFLRHLGADPKMSSRYHVFTGQMLDTGKALALGATFAAAKKFLKDKVIAHTPTPRLKEQGTSLLDSWHLPEEVLRGDGVVTTRSAELPGAGHTTRTTCNHLSILSNEKVLQEVLVGLVKQ